MALQWNGNRMISRWSAGDTISPLERKSLKFVYLRVTWKNSLTGPRAWGTYRCLPKVIYQHVVHNLNMWRKKEKKKYRISNKECRISRDGTRRRRGFFSQQSIMMPRHHPAPMKINTNEFAQHIGSPPQIHRHFCLRRPKTFSRKGFWTSKSFSLVWFRYSFFSLCPFVCLCG